MEEEIRAHVFFSGIVQGVFFRAHTAEKASGLGLRGWVRNLSDGRVEAVFEGPRKDVEAAIAYCVGGQPHARVDDMKVEWEEPTGEGSFRRR
ncbi:MAG: acylphosphatase [Thermoplasmata archaeon]|nr:acylphosphatase [Thermoplasmata archaeon]